MAEEALAVALALHNLLGSDPYRPVPTRWPTESNSDLSFPVSRTVTVCSEKVFLVAFRVRSSSSRRSSRQRADLEAAISIPVHEFKEQDVPGKSIRVGGNSGPSGVQVDRPCGWNFCSYHTIWFQLAARSPRKCRTKLKARARLKRRCLSCFAPIERFTSEYGRTQ